MAVSLFSNLKEIINILSTQFKWDENPYYNMAQTQPFSNSSEETNLLLYFKIFSMEIISQVI